VVFLALKHSVYDTDAHFKIDPITRTIKSEAPSKTVLIQYDHNSERFTFELARRIDGHDMSLCDVVQVHYINIDAKDKNLVSKDAHDLDDLQISPDSDDVVIFSWLIDGKATKYAGTLNFLIKFKCIGDDGNPCYVWNTATSSNISVSTGIDNGEYITEEYSDILEQWRHELIEAGSSVSDEQIAQAVEDYIADHPIEVPDSGGNVDLGVTGATVGHTVKISAVDENGKPTAWEAVDFPEGGGASGEDGFSPIATVEQTESGAVISVTDKNGTTTATIENGKDGADGITPEISLFEGSETDGRKKVTIRVERHLPNNTIEIQSSSVLDGAKGDPGEDGKSAYEYAQDAGYTGSESDFAAKLAEEHALACFTSQTTPAQVVAAINAGKNVILIHTDDTFGLLVFTGFLYVQSVNAGVSSGIWDFDGTPMCFSLLGDVGTGKWSFTYDMLADIDDIPEIPGALPNPNALTFTGAVSGTYDGSSAVTINIPVSGGNAEDGFSPIAKVEQTATGAVVSITDKTGTTTATIANGRDGKDGADGKDGYTPQKNVDYFDGKDGQNGKDGQDGQDYVLTPADKSEIAEMAAGMVDVSTANAVSYEEQSLTEAQKAQARQNIGAVKSTGWTAGKNLGTDENGNIIEKDDIFSKDVSGWHPVECLTGATWTNLGYFWDTAGNLVSTQYTGNYISTTEKIPIAPNCSYVVSGIAGVVTLYDASGKNGVQAVVKDDPNTTYPFETNANQYFMGVSHKPTGIWDETRVSVLRTTISKEEYDAIPTKADSLKSLFGKKIVCFGDSLFGMHRGDDSATAFIAAETGATVYNVGFGGCRMSVHHSSGYAEFSMWALAKAIAENNWSAQDSAASKGSSYFPEQLALLKSIDFSDVDIAVIHYGTNDFGAGNVIAMDNPADHDDYTTLCGALRYSIEKLLGAYPKLRIYVSLPVYRYWTDNGVNTYAETYLNVGGKTLPEFVEALRSTAAEYNLPVIDGYYGLGINKENAPTFLSDGTHHNKAGRERFGRYIGRNLISQQTTGKSGSVSGGNVDLTGYATEQFVRDGYQMKGDYLESSELPTAINTALAQAKESGAFDGVDGSDYVLTDADKDEIANEVLAKLPTWNGGSY
jgi:hypothetical protein